MRVLMFHGTEICYNTLNIFSDFVAKSLRKKGIDVGFVDLNCEGEALADEYVREMNSGFDVALAFNSVGQDQTYMESDNVFEYMHAPFINWIVDHPAAHLPYLEEIIADYHIICIDKDQASYVKEYIPNVRSVHFLPLGGSNSSDYSSFSVEEFMKRKYDVIFTGSHAGLDILSDEIRNLPGNLPHIDSEWIEFMLDNRKVNAKIALETVLKDNGISYTDDEFRKYMYETSRVIPFLGAYIREEIIRYLADAGLHIDLFGQGWERLGNLGGISIHNAVPYEESILLCRDTRISLNVMPLFKNGLHDRIPTSMLAGAAVMTDTSGYIEEVFDHSSGHQDLIIYDVSHPEQLPYLIEDSLNDVEKLFKIAEQGRIKAEKILTWDARTDELMEIIKSICSSS